MATEFVGHAGYCIDRNAIFLHHFSTQMELATRPSQHSADNLSHRIIWLYVMKQWSWRFPLQLAAIAQFGKTMSQLDPSAKS